MYLGFVVPNPAYPRATGVFCPSLFATVVSSLLSSYASALRLVIYYAGARLSISPYKDSHPLA